MKNSENQKEPLRKRVKKLTKKKSFRIISIVFLLFLVASIIITVIQIGKGKNTSTVTTTVQTATASGSAASGKYTPWRR